MRFWRVVGTVLWKDLLTEARTRESVLSMTVFGIAVLVVFAFAFDPNPAEAESLGPGILWVAIAFSGVLGLGRLFQQEREAGGLSALALSPVDGGAVYLGKMLGGFTFLTAFEIILVPAYIVLLNVTPGPAFWGIVPVLLAGSLGYSAVGTVFSAVSVQTRMREVLLPILLFPLLIPLLIAAVSATSEVVGQQDFPWKWLRIILVYDVVFLTASFLIFEFILEES